jgi:hypothetical protein
MAGQGCVLTAAGKASDAIQIMTTMSWLNERPRPVPSPAGLVVKKGLNIFSFTSGGMPLPGAALGERMGQNILTADLVVQRVEAMSRILISTLSPRFVVAAVRVGS